MSEPMALETLAEHLLRFEGYWTQTRVPFKTRRGNSDWDVVGMSPSGRVVVAECKGVGSPRDYLNWDTPAKQRKIERWCKKAEDNWRYFLRSPANKRLQLRRINEFRLFLPGKLPRSNAREKLEARLQRKYSFPVRLFSVQEIIQKLKLHVQRDMKERGKRYADPALEMIRWLLRAGGDIVWRSD
ncbi:MAG: hypothetical protein ACE5IP_03285 [Terriglobia bacterium]